MSTAEMVIRLLDGSEQSSPNYMPDGSQNVPTVDSVAPRNQLPPVTPTTTPEQKSDAPEVAQQLPNYLTNATFIDSMDEFTRRVESAIEASRDKRNPRPESQDPQSPAAPTQDSSEAVTALNTAVDVLRRFSPKWLDGVISDLQKSFAGQNRKPETESKPLAELANAPATNSIPTVSSVSESLLQSSNLIAERVEETNRRLQSIIDSLSPSASESKVNENGGSAIPEQDNAASSPSTEPPNRQPSGWVRQFTNQLSRRIGKTRVGRIGQSIARRAAPKAKAIGTRLGKLARRPAPKASAASSTAVRRAAGSVLARAGASAATASGTAATGAGVTATGATGAGAATAAGGAAVAGGGALAVGAAIALPVAALAALGYAAYKTKEAFDDAADSIEKFSPGVNYQRARARANTEINMLERSRVIGGTASQIETAKTHLQDSTERLWTRMLSLLETFSPLITKGTDSLSLMVDMASAALASLDVVKSRLTVTDWQDDATADASLAQAKSRVNESWDKLFNGTNRKVAPPTFDAMFERFRKSVENDKR